MVYLFFIISLTLPKNFRFITTIPVEYDEGTRNIPIGDANHNGENEIYLGYSSIYEWVPGDSFVLRYTYPPRGGYGVTVLGLGDIDPDSLADVMIYWSSSDGLKFGVFESPSYDSFPTESVWVDTVTDLGNAAGGVPCDAFITDLDQDGKKEIFGRWRTSTPFYPTKIFECTGDNQYTLVYNEPAALDDYVGALTWGDWDNDGKIEFAYGEGQYGPLYIYENTEVGVDEYTFIGPTNDTLNTDNAYSLASNGDMDGDGWDEFVVGGVIEAYIWPIPPFSTFTIFEADGDNSYKKREELTFTTHRMGGDYGGALPMLRIGDIDGDNIPELVMCEDESLWVYKAIENDHYIRIGSAFNINFMDTTFLGPSDGSAGSNVAIYDLNNNGYNDIVWSGYSTIITEDAAVYETVILEYNPLQHDVGIPEILPKRSIDLSYYRMLSEDAKAKGKDAFIKVRENPYPTFAINPPEIPISVKKGSKIKEIDPMRFLSFSPGTTITPQAVVYNWGENPESYNIAFCIDSNGVRVGSENHNGVVDSKKGVIESFTPLNVGGHGTHYEMEAWMVNAVNDENLENDTIKEDFWAVKHLINSPYTKNPPNIDGEIDSNEWSDAYEIDVSDFMGTGDWLDPCLGGKYPPGAFDSLRTGYMWIKNDSNWLYIATMVSDTTLGNSPEGIMWLYIDDNGDMHWPSSPDDSTEGRYIFYAYLNDTSTTTLSYEGIRVGENSTVGDIKTPYLCKAKYDGKYWWTYEMEIKIDTIWYGLNITPVDTIRALILIRDENAYNGAYRYKVCWPEDAYYHHPWDVWRKPTGMGKIALSTEPSGVIKERRITYPSRNFYARLIGNPSRGTATIEYSLKNSTNVNLRIFDIAGRLVAEPINKEMDVGVHRIIWAGSASGIYFYRLKAGKETATGKIILVK